MDENEIKRSLFQVGQTCMARMHPVEYSHIQTSINTDINIYTHSADTQTHMNPVGEGAIVYCQS